MARRKLTVIETAIRDAAKELRLPKDHWNVEKLATMQVMLKVARHKWSQNQASNAAGDMLQLMDAITALKKEAAVAEPLAISVEFVNGTEATCPQCKHVFNPHDGEPVRRESNPVPKPAGEAPNGLAGHAVEAPKPAPPPPTLKERHDLALAQHGLLRYPHRIPTIAPAAAVSPWPDISEHQPGRVPATNTAADQWCGPNPTRGN